MSATSRAKGAADRRAWDIAERITGPCTCIDAYKDRSLIDPECTWHRVAHGIAAAILSEQADFHGFQKASVADHDRLCERNARLTEEVARLRAFAREVVRDAWRGGGDGGSVQDAAERHGLIVPAIYDPEKHGEIDHVERGDETFVFADWLKSPAGHKE